MFMPQVGQALHLFLEGRGPLAATVAKVHSPHMVNISFLDELGDEFPKSDVAVPQEGEDLPSTYVALPVEVELPEEAVAALPEA